MKNKNKILRLLIAGLIMSIFYSCATFGGRTMYYKKGYTQSIKNIGYTDLEGDTIIEKIFKNTNKIYKETTKSFLLSYGINSIEFEKNTLIFSNPDTTEIVKICRTNNLDALILTRLSFINVTYTMYFIPYAQNLDTEVEMKVYDNRGNLISHTIHNTLQGNSYMFAPPTERTIKDGTEGNLKRIVKNLHLIKIN